MTVSTILALTPQLIVATGIVFALLLIAWQRSQQIIALFSLGVLLLAFVATLLSFSHGSTAVTPLVIVDDYSRYAFVLVCLTGFFVIYLSRLMLSRQIEVHDEYYVLVLLVILGAGILVVSDHFASLFLGFELLSLSLVGLVGYLRESKYSVETGFKYLILSASASSFMLLGIAFIYAYTGSLVFSSMAPDVSSVIIATAQTNKPPVDTGLINNGLYQLGVILFLCGMAFKLSLAPFHLWTADVYQGAPTPVTLLLATISKLAVFIVLVKCLFSAGQWQTMQGLSQLDLSQHDLLQLDLSQHGSALQGTIIIVAIMSMLVGNILALKQQSIKRILGYSSIAHMGYLFIVLAISSSATVAFAWQTVLFYFTAYIIATLSLFTVLTLYELNHRQVNDVTVTDWQGLFWQQPLLALLAITGLLALAGIPLTAGFIGKFYLIHLASQNQLWWLLGSLIIGSGISLAYYLPIIFQLFAHNKAELNSPSMISEPLCTETIPSELSNNTDVNWQHGYSKILVLLLIFTGLGLGIFPDTLSRLLSGL
jgi:NADH-quinone oxidoreductase subunit N